MVKGFIKKYRILEILIVEFVLALDFWLKAYAARNFQNQSIKFIPGLINLTYFENNGAAFGMMSGQMTFFFIITAIIVPVVLIYLVKSVDENPILKISLALIFAGAVGNFVDRVALGYVRDMIDFAFMRFAVFNIADAALTIGTVLLCIYILFIYKEPLKQTVKIEESTTKSEAEENSSGVDISLD